MKKESISYKFYKYSIFTFLMLMSAINYNLFINPAKIVAGGTSGISVILEDLFGFNPAITLFILSMVILGLSVLTKHYEEAGSALYAAIIYPFFVTITQNLNGILQIRTVDMFLIAIISAVITSIVNGVVTNYKMSSGGSILISQIIADKLRLSLAKVNFFVNLIIVVAGGTIFGIKSIIYASIYLMVNKIVMEKITIGSSKNKIFQIITVKETEVKEYISNVLGAGSTTFGVQGSFEERKKTVIMTAVTNSDYFKLKEGIHNIDKNAFIVITDSYQVQGGK